MAGFSDDQDEMIQGINVTPLVDVVLVLLVIFMMAAPTLYNGRIEVELPAASSAEHSQSKTLKFTLRKDGSILLDGSELKRETIAMRVQGELKKNSQTDAIVAADKSLSHGQVVELIDLLKSSGISRFAIAVDSPGGSRI